MSVQDRRREPGGSWLIDASGVMIGVVLPIAMFVFSRSSPLIVSMAAALALAGIAHAGKFDALVGVLGRAVRRPWALALAASLAFLLISLFWSHFPRAGLPAYGELFVSLGAVVLLAACYRVERPAELGRFLAIGLVLGALLTVADLRSDLWFRKALGLRDQSFVLNRTVVSAMLLLFPLALLLRARERWLWPVAALAVGAAIWHSESGTALVGAAVAAAAALAARIAPRVTLTAILAGTMCVLAAAPWLGTIMMRALPDRLHTAVEHMHSRDRVDIWNSFGAAVRERPVLGSGFHASARMADDPVALRVPPERRTLLGAGHPHNAFLQIWVEGGAVGAALFGVLLASLAGPLMRLRGGAAVAVGGFAAGAALIAAVSHGAWQGWWIAVVGLSIALLAVGRGEHAHA